MQTTASAPAPKGRPLMTIRDVAELAGVSERTVRAWRASGALPVIKFSRGSVRVDPRDYDRFLEQRRQGGEA